MLKIDLKKSKLNFFLFVLVYSCNSHSDVNYDKIEELFQNKEYNEFVSETDILIESNKFDLQQLNALYYKRAIAFYEMNRNEEALNSINKSLNINDDYFESLMLKAQIFESLVRFDSAIVYYTKCIEQNFDADKCYNNRGLIYYNYKNRFNDALNDFNEAIRINNNDGFYYNNKGLVLEELGESDSAIIYFDYALNSDSLNSIILLNKSVSLFSIKDSLGALVTINKAVTLSPNSDILLLNRGLLFIQLNKFENACEDLIKSSSLGNKEANSYISKYCKSVKML
jgi:tetratricopeptide (TPR) repeat protein